MSLDPVVMCPSCGTEIKLNESLAAPLVAATKQDYEKRLSLQASEFAKREQSVKTREAQLTVEKEAIDKTLADKLKAEREKLQADATKRDKAFAEREAALLKDRETLDTTVADRVRAERSKLAADAAKAEQVFKEREEALAKDRESVDATIVDKLKAERARIAADLTKREQIFKEREEALLKEREAADAAIAEKLKTERARIAAEEARKAKLAIGDDLEQKAGQIAELNAVLLARDEKLAEAQKAQAELVKKSRDLDDAKREMELTIETRISSSLVQVRESAKRDAEQELSLKVIEKDLTIKSMMEEIDNLKRKAEQGSQERQGEALEWQLEHLLTSKFLHDTIDSVPRGEHGGDLLQRVRTPVGTACGTIIWESKRTKTWQDGWLPKLRNDQRTAKAEIAVIVSSVLPKDVDTFDQIDGVWVVHPRCVIPIAMSLRNMLIEVNTVRQAGEGQQTKMEMIYHYLTGPKFRLRVQAIVEAFSSMSDDLVKEKKVILKQWAKREEQIGRVMEATVGMYGELQGIAGKSLLEVEGLNAIDSADSPTALPE